MHAHSSVLKLDGFSEIHSAPLQSVIFHMSADSERALLYRQKGEIPEGKNGYYAMPIVHNHNGLITINYGGEFIQARHQDTRPSAGTAFCCKHISSMLSHVA